ncbi:MAG: hypothetical protein P4L40_20520 [Terracidiphilus sp.]|nr:hypothetical protein [Terracidiphilus sp.]
MKTTNKTCTVIEGQLADLLLAPESVPAKVTAHVAECASCARELQDLRATMALMDSWQVPEPSPYFLTRLNARLDEEREAAPAGWFERLRARFTYGSQLHARPVAAMALTVVLFIGGGAYLGFTNWEQPVAPPQTAVVHDLQVLDNNDQLLDQLETISNDSTSDGTVN